jgi:pimeloyl-ACP methyl ester carboxylesterase
MTRLLCLCLVVVTGWSTAHAQVNPPEPGTFFLYPERIVLKNGGYFLADRGTMYVPRNRSRGNQEVIAIEVYRFKASRTADPDTPPIFLLHGGPRFEGLANSLSQPGIFEERFRPFLEVADLVVVSQRGIGASKPSTVVETTTRSRSPDRPYDNAQAVRAFQKVIADEKALWESAGVDLAGLTVIEAAADVNDVRKALGYDKITLWGGSFGSHWAMALMRFHPEIVERAVLRGMEGPDHTYDHPGHVWNVYKRVAEEAEVAMGMGDQMPERGLIEALKAMVEQVEREPVTVDVTLEGKTTSVLIDGHSIRRVIRGYTGGMSAWPADAIALAKGDFEKAAEAVARRYHETDDTYDQHWDQTRESYLGRTFLTASYFALDCASGITSDRLAAYHADEGWEVLGDLNWKYTAGCPVWDVDLGNAFRQNFETEIPTLIVQGTWDTSTPYENAIELLPYFKNGRLVTVKRGPHGALRAAMSVSKVFERAVWAFAKSGDMSGLPEVVEVPIEWVVPE